MRNIYIDLIFREAAEYSKNGYDVSISYYGGDIRVILETMFNGKRAQAGIIISEKELNHSYLPKERIHLILKECEKLLVRLGNEQS